MKINAMLVQFLAGLVNVVMETTKKKFIMNYVKYLKNGLKFIKKIIFLYHQVLLQKNSLVNSNRELTVIYIKHLLFEHYKQMKV